jgi:trehalose synthase
MTRLMAANLRPSSARAARVLAYFEESAADALAGRTTWCATGLAGSSHVAHALRTCLECVGDAGVDARGLRVAADAPLRLLAERLDEMLHGGGATAGLGRGEEEIYTTGKEESDLYLGQAVVPGDVVVLHDPLTVLLAEAVRERGAHAVWHIEIAPHRGAPAASPARLFLREYTTPVDAIAMSWTGSDEGGRRVERISALMPAADSVTTREIPASGDARDRFHHVGWSSVLADVLAGDREETVGGTLHARPAVARR